MKMHMNLGNRPWCKPSTYTPGTYKLTSNPKLVTCAMCERMCRAVHLAKEKQRERERMAAIIVADDLCDADD